MSHDRTELDLVNDTGFPLQTYVEAVARRTQNSLHWYPLKHEHRYKDPRTGETGFVDLVLGRQMQDAGSWYRVRLVIECKRVDGTWVFLLPRDLPTDMASTMNSRALQTAPRLFEGSRWSGLWFGPVVPQSEYCAMGVRNATRANQKDTRRLESLSSGLIGAIEGIALQELETLKHERPEIVGAVYIPVIVTTATLHCVIYNPATVGSLDGRIPTEAATLAKDQPVMRFAKDFGFGPLPKHPLAPEENTAFPGAQTVFVVNAAHFETFLTQCARFRSFAESAGA